MSNRGVRPIVCGSDGQPIAGATVALYQIVQLGTTDKDGGITFSLDVAATDVCVKVLTPGYETYLQSPLLPAHDVNIGIGTPVGPTDVQLSSLRPNLPPHAVVDVRAGFCNLHDNKGRPIFSPYFPCLPGEDQVDWITRWQAAGMWAQAIMIDDPTYPEALPQYGTFYPAPGFAPSASQFASAANTLLGAGITPLVFCTNGSYPTDLSAFEAKLTAYCQPFADVCQFVEGWEPYWTNAQHQALYAIMRRVLGPNAVLALHLPSNYIHNGGGTADWDTAFKEVNVFLMELSPAANMTDAANSEAGWLQCIQRTIPTPGVPYYLGGRTLCIMEQVAYYQIRGYITDADINSIMAWNMAQGVKWLGNANSFKVAA